jgi:hypothetical protein
VHETHLICPNAPIRLANRCTSCPRILHYLLKADLDQCRTLSNQKTREQGISTLVVLIIYIRAATTDMLLYVRDRGTAAVRNTRPLVTILVVLAGLLICIGIM